MGSVPGEPALLWLAILGSADRSERLELQLRLLLARLGHDQDTAMPEGLGFVVGDAQEVDQRPANHLQLLRDADDPGTIAVAIFGVLDMLETLGDGRGVGEIRRGFYSRWQQP